MTIRTYSSSVKVVSRLHALPVGETIYAGTTETRLQKDSETIHLGTTEADVYKNRATVYGGTTEANLISKLFSATVYAGTTEARMYNMLQSMTPTITRIRSGIVTTSQHNTYSRVRNQVLNAKVWPRDFAAKVVSDSTSKIPLVQFEWLFDNLGVQLVGESAIRKLTWDSYYTLHWNSAIDSAPDDYWFLITYQDYPYGTTPERPIQYSLPETTSTTPTLVWESDANADGHAADDLVYEIEVSLNQNMTSPFYTDTEAWTDTVYIQHQITDTLTVGKRYYWHIRLYDGVAYSPWSSTKYFDVVETRYATVPINLPNGGHPVLISGRWKHYHWDTSNLPSMDDTGTYIKRRLWLYQYKVSSSDPEEYCTQDGPPVVFPKPGAVTDDCIYIDHAAGNPPVFTIVSYDQYSHYMLLGVKIIDSQSRKYNLIDFRYKDDRIATNPWIQIPKSRIIGQTTNLGPDPDNKIFGIFTWLRSSEPDNAYYATQTTYYDLVVLKNPAFQDNSFYWNVRQYLFGSHEYDMMQFGFGDGTAWISDIDTSDIPSISWTGADAVPHAQDADSSSMTDLNESTYESIVSSGTNIVVSATLNNTFFVESIELLLSNASEITIEYYYDDEWVTAGFNTSLSENDTYRIEYAVGLNISDFRVTVKGTGTVKIYSLSAFGRPNKIIGTSDVGPIYVNAATTDFVQNDLTLSWLNYVTHDDPSVIDPSTFDPPVNLPRFYIAPSKIRYQVVLTRDQSTVLMSISGVSTKTTTITSVDLSLNDVTNVLFEKKDLTDNQYQMNVDEIELFYQKAGEDQFYWTVRSRDEYDSLGWAPFQEWEYEPVYYILWDITGLDLPPADKYKVSAYMYLSASNEAEYQNENLRWKDRANSEQAIAKAATDAYTDLIKTEFENSLELYERLNNAETDETITFSW